MKRRAPFSISNALSALKRGKAGDTDGLLLPADIIKKILACLPARECWRIGTQLSKRFSQWAKSVINIYHARIEPCEIDEETGAEEDLPIVYKTEVRFRHDTSMLEIKFTGFQEQIERCYTTFGVAALVNCNGKPLRYKPMKSWSQWGRPPHRMVEGFEKKIAVIIE